MITTLGMCVKPPWVLENQHYKIKINNNKCLKHGRYDPSLLSFFLTFLSIKFGPKILFINKIHHMCTQLPEAKVEREIKRILKKNHQFRPSPVWSPFDTTFCQRCWYILVLILIPCFLFCIFDALTIKILGCYSPFHSNNIIDTTPLDCIKLNLSL